MGDLLADLNQLNVSLSVECAERQALFLDEMLRWNQQINLTSICDLDAAREKHLVDSLALLPYLAEKGLLLDMGSGGGLPGIPLAIAREGLQVTSVDSVGKKINFQKHIKRTLKLENLTPIQSRLEDLRLVLDVQQQFNYVVARAFSSFEVIIRLAENFLAANGELLVMKGPGGISELKAAGGLMQMHGFKLIDCYKYQLPQSKAERHLLVLGKLLPENR